MVANHYLRIEPSLAYFPLKSTTQSSAGLWKYLRGKRIERLNHRELLNEIGQLSRSKFTPHHLQHLGLRNTFVLMRFSGGSVGGYYIRLVDMSA